MLTDSNDLDRNTRADYDRSVRVAAFPWVVVVLYDSRRRPITAMACPNRTPCLPHGVVYEYRATMVEARDRAVEIRAVLRAMVARR